MGLFGTIGGIFGGSAGAAIGGIVDGIGKDKGNSETSLAKGSNQVQAMADPKNGTVKLTGSSGKEVGKAASEVLKAQSSTGSGNLGQTSRDGFDKTAAGSKSTQPPSFTIALGQPT
jgi:hypothetical protein